MTEVARVLTEVTSLFDAGKKEYDTIVQTQESTLLVRILTQMGYECESEIDDTLLMYSHLTVKSKQ